MMKADGRFGRAATTGAMRVRRCGFTMIELMLVVMIGAVLMGIALPMFAEVRASQQLQNARNGFISLAQRARAEAIQSGAIVELELNLAEQRAEVYHDGTMEMIEAVDYERIAVHVATDDGESFTLCYSPRGYALQSCNGKAVEERIVLFSRGADTVRARVGALGTAERP